MSDAPITRTILGIEIVAVQYMPSSGVTCRACAFGPTASESCIAATNGNDCAEKVYLSLQTYAVMRLKGKL